MKAANILIFIMLFVNICYASKMIPETTVDMHGKVIREQDPNEIFIDLDPDRHSIRYFEQNKDLCSPKMTQHQCKEYLINTPLNTLHDKRNAMVESRDAKFREKVSLEETHHPYFTKMKYFFVRWMKVIGICIAILGILSIFI
jgi:23S rRNA maturation-related 3'-5' exoribonuclease YhaM